MEPLKKEEEWRVLKGYDGFYLVSNKGRVKSTDAYFSNGKAMTLRKGRILKLSKSHKGYLRASLSKKRRRFNIGVHRLVALCFIHNEYNKPQVNHIDGNKSNNNVENLEWVTNSENQIHAIENKLIKHNTGDKHHMSKLSNEDVQVVRDLRLNGRSITSLALDYKVSITAMSNILSCKTYKNV